MTSRALAGCVMLVVLAGCGSGSGDGGGGQVTINFAVAVPATTTGAVYVGGDIPALGTWDARGLTLIDLGGNHWAGSITVDAAATKHISYKYTRGTWGMREVTAACADFVNRELAVTAPVTSATDTVEAWADSCP